MNLFSLLLAVLSIWDYPVRQPMHERLRDQFIQALREGDTVTMEETCRKGVELLPDDPTWHYNLACSLAYYKNAEAAFDELECAIDLGFRDVEAIKNDNDLKRISNLKRYAELVDYAETMKTRPILIGPMANVKANGLFGRTISIGEQNLLWDFDFGCFKANLELVANSAGGNVGDLYMNRDGMHSPLRVEDFPGLTRIMLDASGRERGMDLDIPNIEFPYPVFGNASRAFTDPKFWRSLPRSLMTTNALKLKAMRKFYLTNQFWVFPSNEDTPPIGTKGDVFPAQTPYYLVTAGKSYSDQYYLRAALETSRSFSPAVKKELVKRGHLAPTLQSLIRHSLQGVTDEEKYLSPLAHPTAFPPNGLDMERLKSLASSMKLRDIPPVVALKVSAAPTSDRTAWPELLFSEPFAVSYILRSKDETRSFTIQAFGAGKYEFVQVHGDSAAVKIEKLGPAAVKVTLKKSLIPVNDRVDIAVFGSQGETMYGAPSFVSFATVDPKAEYSDPFLTPLDQPSAAK